MGLVVLVGVSSKGQDDPEVQIDAKPRTTIAVAAYINKVDPPEGAREINRIKAHRTTNGLPCTRTRQPTLCLYMPTARMAFSVNLIAPPICWAARLRSPRIEPLSSSWSMSARAFLNKSKASWSRPG